MAYERTIWENGITPINAANLNNLEEGVSERIVKKLLWQNASPTSDFATQTISVNLSEYDFVEIIYKTHATSSEHSKVEIPVGVGGYMSVTGGSTTANAYMAVRYRYISATSVTGVTFSSGYISWSGKAETSNNTMAIPLKIYGIKGVQ